jgi:hypothetical protein
MKRIHLLPVLTFLISLAGRSQAADAPVVLSEQEIRAIGPLPEDKIADTMKKGEYNPFGERAATQVTKEDGESEDSKLSTILKDLPLTGIIQDNDGRYKVMLGGRLYAEGDRVDKYLTNQTTLQRISKVTEKVVEISWVEDQAGAPPHKVIRQVRVKEPLVEQRRKIPGADGKSAGIMSTKVTSSGETLHDEAAEQPADKAIPSANNGGEAPQLNHRPVAPNVRGSLRNRAQ